MRGRAKVEVCFLDGAEDMELSGADAAAATAAVSSTDRCAIFFLVMKGWLIRIDQRDINLMDGVNEYQLVELVECFFDRVAVCGILFDICTPYVEGLAGYSSVVVGWECMQLLRKYNELRIRNVL